MSQVQKLVEVAVAVHQVPVVPAHLDAPGDGRAVGAAQQQGDVDLGQGDGVVLEQEVVVQGKGDVHRQLLHLRADPVLILLAGRGVEAEPGKGPDVVVMVGEGVLQGGGHGVHVEARQGVAVPGLRREGVQGGVDDADLLQVLVAELLIVLHHHAAAHGPAQQRHILQTQVLDELVDVLGAAVHGQVVQALGGGAVAPPVHQHQPVVGGEGLDVLIKEFGGTEIPVEDQDGIPLVLAVVLEIDPGAVADLEEIVLALDHASAPFLSLSACRSWRTSHRSPRRRTPGNIPA